MKLPNELTGWIAIVLTIITLIGGSVTYIVNLHNKVSVIQEKFKTSVQNTTAQFISINKRFDEAGITNEKIINHKIAKNGVTISRQQTELSELKQKTAHLEEIKAEVAFLMDREKENTLGSGPINFSL